MCLCLWKVFEIYFIYLKIQTCLNCGTPGHIARNYPHPSYVPYYKQGWQNVPSGRYSTRNPSRSRSSNGDWNAKKTKKQTFQDKKIDLRDNFPKPKSMRPKSS